MACSRTISADQPRTSRPCDPVPQRGNRGVTLVEVALGLVILALAVCLALDVVGRIQHRRRCDQVIADLRDFAADAQHRVRPVNPPPAEIAGDPVAAERPINFAVSKESPVGGFYEWVPPAAKNPPSTGEPPAGRSLGAIRLTGFPPGPPLTLSHADLLYLDAQLDDGDLATGRFRTGFNGWPVCQLGAQP